MDKIILKRMKGLLSLALAAVVLWQSGLGVLAANINNYTLHQQIPQGENISYGSGSTVYVDGAQVAGGNNGTYTTTAPLWVVTPAAGFGNGKLYLSTTDPRTQTGTVGGNHVHELRWRTTIQPTDTTDGKREYGCECGHVEKSEVISFIQYVLEKMVKDIEDAKKGATIKVDCKLIRCLTDEIVEALLARPDVALELNFQEGETAYTVTIPAGKAPTDGQQWYGVFYLGSLYGYSRITPVK